MMRKRFRVQGSRFTVYCLLLTALCLLLPGAAGAANEARVFTGLTGETTGTLDNVDIYDLTNGDIGFVVVGNILYVYQYNSTSTSCSTEVSPTYIQPKNFSTTGCWHLVSSRAAGLDTGRSANPCWSFKDSDTTDSDTNGTICFDCSATGSGAEDCAFTFSTQVDGTLAARFKLTANGGVTPVRSIYAKTSNYTVTAADMGAVLTNLGATGVVTFTLPEASTVLGEEVWFNVLANYGLKIDPADASDKILGMTDAAGDSILADAEGESIGLRAVGANSWAPIYPYGTWSDAN